MYSCHLFLIYYASVRSIPFLSFIVPIFALQSKSGYITKLCGCFYLLLLSSHSVLSNSLRPHGLQNASLPSPLPSPGACSKSCPSSRWCHPTISSSVVLFSSWPQSFPASGSFLASPLFASGSQSIGVSASTSVFPMNIGKYWFPLGWTGWILQCKELSRVFSNTTVWKHQSFSAHLSL